MVFALRKSENSRAYDAARPAALAVQLSWSSSAFASFNRRVKTFAARHVTETRRPSGHRVSLSMRQSSLDLERGWWRLERSKRVKLVAAQANRRGGEILLEMR